MERLPKAAMCGRRSEPSLLLSAVGPEPSSCSALQLLPSGMLVRRSLSLDTIPREVLAVERLKGARALCLEMKEALLPSGCCGRSRGSTPRKGLRSAVCRATCEGSLPDAPAGIEDVSAVDVGIEEPVLGGASGDSGPPIHASAPSAVPELALPVHVGTGIESTLACGEEEDDEEAPSMTCSEEGSTPDGSAPLNNVAAPIIVPELGLPVHSGTGIESPLAFGEEGEEEEEEVARTLGIQEVEPPSVGSIGHREGRCEPCLFIVRQGCLRGAGCLYCHIPHEEGRKRLRPSKKLRKKMARRRDFMEQLLSSVLLDAD